MSLTYSDALVKFPSEALRSSLARNGDTPDRLFLYAIISSMSLSGVSAIIMMKNTGWSVTKHSVNWIQKNTHFDGWWPAKNSMWLMHGWGLFLISSRPNRMTNAMSMTAIGQVFASSNMAINLWNRKVPNLQQTNKNTKMYVENHVPIVLSKSHTSAQFDLAQTKISQFHMARCCQKHIVRFDVAMDNSMLM